MNVGSGTLDLYIDAGTVVTGVGILCEDGNGDELCAVDVTVTLTGPGEIDGFVVPLTGPVVIFEPTTFPPGTKTVRLNLLQSASPPSPLIPQHLGTVSVNVYSSASSVDQVKIVANGQVVNAGGTLVGIPSIEVPEPSEKGGPVEPDPRARDQLGYVPEYDAERGFREYIEFLRTGTYKVLP